MDGAGNITFWGYSPSLCLSKYIDQHLDDAPMRILLIGCGDIRHLLHTLTSVNQPIEPGAVRKKYRAETLAKRLSPVHNLILA